MIDIGENEIEFVEAKKIVTGKTWLMSVGFISRQNYKYYWGHFAAIRSKDLCLEFNRWLIGYKAVAPYLSNTIITIKTSNF